MHCLKNKTSSLNEVDNKDFDKEYKKAFVNFIFKPQKACAKP